ncbi:MAG TPA: response regulator transcription factor [Kiritimatiellia bacterium]|nr:response regulator transcription factor [Kiritimatiellia bacterium]
MLLVDDHAFVRKAIRRLLEVEPDLRVCGEASTRERAVHLVRTLHPDVVLLDLALPNEDGLTMIRELRAMFGPLPILVVSLHKESLFSEPALHAGADGYLMKNDASDHLVEAVRTVLDHRLYVSAEIREAILGRLRGVERNARWGVAPKRTGVRASLVRRTGRRPIRNSAR